MAHTLLTLSYNILFSRPFHFFQYHFLHRILSVLFLFYLLVYKMLLERSYSCSISLLEYLSKSFFTCFIYSSFISTLFKTIGSTACTTLPISSFAKFALLPLEQFVASFDIRRLQLLKYTVRAEVVYTCRTGQLSNLIRNRVDYLFTNLSSCFIR